MVYPFWFSITLSSTKVTFAFYIKMSLLQTFYFAILLFKTYSGFLMLNIPFRNIRFVYVTLYLYVRKIAT